MFEKTTLIKGAIVLIAILAALEILSPAVLSVETSTMGDLEGKAMAVIKYFFEVTPIAILAGFGWSLFGFIRYKLGDAAVKYEVEKLYTTWAWFEGILIVITVGLPLPYSTAIAGIIMAIKSAFSTLRNPPPLTTQPVSAQKTPTGPGPPAT